MFAMHSANGGANIEWVGPTDEELSSVDYIDGETLARSRHMGGGGGSVLALPASSPAPPSCPSLLASRHRPVQREAVSVPTSAECTLPSASI
jgi:hypothetical protein